MSDDEDRMAECIHYFLSTGGVKLPLKLINPIGEDQLEHRNTYFRAEQDSDGRIRQIEKLVYGEVVFRHLYRYYPSGALRQAEVTMIADDETTLLEFQDQRAQA